ncbi:hypothetical protein A2801_02150 [Candidatus Woesebacteria bacterium RIFCSPHIGHO2_01_FULL_41_10]|uniref:Uncharacterized protein n=1 Tax=Candidatus Woesebacteria bacterium RIFCSPHIGHO2_01_FULL_41_10 TaxID=1802500 RepID=A0A1F7YS26_9BACT|nr:MAG: hypothetical protein A2801_02150 [Candidatus Woesebacteria bacterium RIFCSPHIGHO2_01_FULL_41_10]
MRPERSFLGIRPTPSRWLTRKGATHERAATLTLIPIDGIKKLTSKDLASQWAQRYKQTCAR